MREHEQQAIFASVLQTAVDAIVIIDESGTIESVNPATERMFGFTSHEMRGRNVKLLMPPPDHELHDGYLKHYYETGERQIIGIGREVTGKRKDGSTFPLHLAVSEIDAGQRKLFTGIMRDISDLKAAHAALQQLNATLDQRVRVQANELQQVQSELNEKEKFATLGRISGGIAHEIRNPLNAIKTSAYFLRHADSLSEAKRLEHLTRIDRQVTIIDSAVTALSELARLSEPTSGPCDMIAMLDEIIEGKQLTEGIVVQRNYSPELPAAFVDENQIPIVFKNLIRNARDAMPSGGTLTLSARAENDRIIISVQDTGTGIASEILERIHEPFFSTKARGMGLGLAITKTIIEKNRGTIQIQTKLAHGTTFSVSLPTQDSSSSSR